MGDMPKEWKATHRIRRFALVESVEVMLEDSPPTTATRNAWTHEEWRKAGTYGEGLALYTFAEPGGWKWKTVAPQDGEFQLEVEELVRGAR